MPIMIVILFAVPLTMALALAKVNDFPRFFHVSSHLRMDIAIFVSFMRLYVYGGNSTHVFGF